DKMNSSKIIFYSLISLLIIIVGFFGCNNQMSEIEEKEELLEYFLSNLNENDNPIYYETLPKEKIVDYLDEGFSLDNVFFLSEPSDSLEIYFSKEVISGFSESIKNYKKIIVTEELTDGHKVVEQKEIPDFLKDSSIPPPFNYSGFNNVYFLSTPIISENRGIIFIDSYGEKGLGITIRFYIRRNKNAPWEVIDSGSVHEVRYYQ
ncbi:hypothetical protein, partial [Balneola sp. EhC07]|uniref:hypothetical protein n=1 Tax=Balneola sp. EhC07 TaxID=1849360 RepID=UPI001F3D9BB2